MQMEVPATAGAIARHFSVLLLVLHYTPIRAAVQPPNVLFIVIDDLGFDDVGFRSHEIKTPTIDSLAHSGVILDQYYVQDVCSPSRSTFMTGRFSMHNSIVDWIPPASAYGLPLNETTMAQKFKAAGYATHAVGKWHLGFYKWGMTPTFRGFDSFVGFYSGGEDYFTHMAGGAYDFRRDPSPNCGPGCSQVDWQDQNMYSTTVFTREATRVVKEHNFNAQPLFVYLAYQGVHAPAQVPESYEVPYENTIADKKRRTFAGMLSCVDEGIKNVTEALAAQHQLENTIIVFTADNGGPTTTGDGVGARNWPLRGGKHSIWEGGTRATAFVSGTPMRLAGGPGLYTGLMHGADWLPTLSSIAGYNLTGTLPLDGVNQWAAITGTALPPRDTVVIGNSTNECSWEVSDPRYHGHASVSAHGADLPAGAFSVGGSAAAVGCGFAIKKYVGAQHWKLIKGYGGGPDTWCNSTAGEPSCGEPETTLPWTTQNGACAIQNGTCYPSSKNLIDMPLTNASACCAACDEHPACVAFTWNVVGGPTKVPTCYLKSTMDNTTRASPDCVSGTTRRTPLPPTPPPEPRSSCPGGWCLYDTAVDPYELHECSAANADVVAEMQAMLADVLKSYTQYEIDPSCPPVQYQNDSHVGRAWQPWC